MSDDALNHKMSNDGGNNCAYENNAFDKRVEWYYGHVSNTKNS